MNDVKLSSKYNQNLKKYLQFTIKLIISQFPHASGFSPMHSSHRTKSNFIDRGFKDDVDAEVFKVLYACGIPFNVLHSPYWHEMVQAIHNTPNGYKSMTNPKP
jgi:hypothetical protein